jgi:hypothetical protein
MYKTIEQQGNEADEESNVACKEILTTVLASFNKNADIEQAIIYGVTKYIKKKHGFIEPTPYNYKPFQDRAISAIKRVGDDYNPYICYAYAIRQVKEGI